MLTPQQSLILKLAGGAVVLGLLAVGAFSYVSEREARIRMQAVLDAQTSVQKQNADLIAALQKQIADRDAAYQQQLQSLNVRFAQASNPSQIASLVAQVMGLKQPVKIVTAAPTPENPHPEPVAQVSLVDAPQAKAYVQACEECKLELPKVKADLADRLQQQALAQKQIDSLKLERDTAVKAAKGTWLTRTKTAMKYIVVGGGIAVVALAGSGHVK